MVEEVGSCVGATEDPLVGTLVGAEVDNPVGSFVEA